MSLVRQDAFLGSFAALAFLPTQLLALGPGGGGARFASCLDLVQQKRARKEPIHPLLTRGLTFHLGAGGRVNQHHTRGHLVHVLPAMSARPNKALFEINFTNPQRTHALRKLIFLL